MSRIGRNPVIIPEGVNIEVGTNNVLVKGPKGEIKQEFKDIVIISKKDETIVVSCKGEPDKATSAYWGTIRKSIQNMVDGVTNGFEIKLIIEGIGYKSQTNGKTLVLNVGYTHPVEMVIPEGLKVEVKDNVNITVSGIDRYKVGQFAAVIRDKRKPEPYKGRGIRYANEHIRRKVGKTGV